jgi:IS605 OrfB family transposase
VASEIQHSIRTLRLKVKREGYAWLNSAAIEVNQVWNFANATSYKAARPFAGTGKWLSAFDLDKLTAGATVYFDHIGSETIQRVNADLGLKDIAATSDGDKLHTSHFYRNIEQKIANAQRRGHKRQAKRLHRTAARRRKDALHKFSRKIVNEYQTIKIGDVSSLKLAKTRMAKSVLDAGWGILKTQLQYKGQQAGRSVIIVSERDSTRTCSDCKALTGPTGLDMLVVRIWVCSACGVTHDRDVNSARNHLSAGSSPPSVSGNESSLTVAEPSSTYGRCEAGISALKAAA